MKIPPPVYALLFLVISEILQRFFRISYHVPGWLQCVGIFFACVGLVLGGMSLFIFRKQNTTHLPFDEPTSLVVSGPYRFTRNPMYLGVVLILTGLAIYAPGIFYFLAPVGFYMAMNFFQIPMEENILRNNFGVGYELYCQRVRRWL